MIKMHVVSFPWFLQIHNTFRQWLESLKWGQKLSVCSPSLWHPRSLRSSTEARHWRRMTQVRVWESYDMLWLCSGPTTCRCFSFRSPANVELSFVILSDNWDAHQANTHNSSRHQRIWSIGQGLSWETHASMSWPRWKQKESTPKNLR